MIIDTKKFASISQLYISSNELCDMTKGIADVLDYTHKLNTIYSESSVAEKQYVSQENCFRIRDDGIDFEKKILYKNAPDIIEYYFHVPSMIKRK